MIPRIESAARIRRPEGFGFDFAAAQRPNIKAFLAHAGRAWAAAPEGLYRVDRVALILAPAVEGGETVSLGPDVEGGFLAVVKQHGVSVVRYDREGRRRECLPPLPGDDPTYACAGRRTWAGGKRGVYQLGPAGWQRVFTQDEACQVAWIRETDAAVIVAIAKAGSARTPLLVRSEDEGRSWVVDWQGACGDDVVTCDGNWRLCRWTGDQRCPQPLGKPVVAASVAADGRRAVIHDCTLTVTRPAGHATQIRHPSLSRAHWVAFQDDRLLVAGEQGVFAVAGETLRPLLPADAGACPTGRIKRIWPLGADRFLLCATFGTFFSGDAGETWDAVSGDFDVMHVRRLFLDAQGRATLVTQDGIYESLDGGRSWHALDVGQCGLEYGKYSGIAVVADKLVWGGKHGLFLASRGRLREFRPLAGMGQREVKDLVVCNERRVLVLCDGRELFLLDPHAESVCHLCTLPFGDARTIIETAAGTCVFSKRRAVRLRNGRAVELPLPSDGGEFHAAPADAHVLLWDRHHAWWHRLDGEGWELLRRWPEDLLPAHVAPSADGTYALVADAHQVRRLEIETAAARPRWRAYS